MRIFIGSSSNDSIPNKYIKDCTKIIEMILKNNDLVFGGYNKSLMGISYEIAKKNNRIVTAICPEVYKSSLDLLKCDYTKLTNSVLDRTMEMYKNSDVIILLPGGFGTIYEFFTANYCKICNEISIPIIIYNSCGYYDKLLSFITDAYNNKIINENEIGKYFVANNLEELLSFLNNIKNN